ncbi:sensor domain-containing diguanylate cyclase/phosphohydrolase [Clostridium uliginosum]|uniref:PAS domain S-box-containing protein/diguanylate cyclase (GGDEF) domain-containing protein n=1 Tax=Clostridium uliginosum TaxID=119641 RepID=A0A1I1K7Y9_9CLOT|nr:HD domain-containing phosphohydrolase [Clostridium uliginosum]SFC56934.1 PAS domain S-box-containing protein/diguanylate cyclase (GGDEF) domain-containing protein [Clostridium uliginosum]
MDYKIFQLVVENIPQPVWIKDLELKFIYANNEYKKIHNGKRKEFIGLKHEDVFSELVVEKYNDQCNLVIETLESRTEEGYVDGVYRKCTIFPLIDQNGIIKAIAGIDANLGIVKEKDKVIEEQKNLLKVIVDTLPGMIFYKDTEGKYVYANKEYAKFHEKNGVHEIIGKRDVDIQISGELASAYAQGDQEVMKSKKSIFTDIVTKIEQNKTVYSEVVKEPVIDKDGEVVGVVGLVLDVTEKKEIEERLKYLSYTDSLTGAYNRAYFEEKAEEFLNEQYFPVGVIMGDANGLKVINDTLGHLEGDKLLKLITKVLKDVCNKKDLVFRIGGDEFVVLIPNATEDECESMIRKVFQRCKVYRHDLIDISIALGASITNNLSKNIYDTLKDAEDKVYRQKLLHENSINNSIMYSLKAGLETKSMETEEHTERVLENAIVIGEKLHLSTSQMDELIIVAKLHDIGKIGISEEILLKPSRLTNEEFEIIKTHTEKGYRIVKASNKLNSIAKGVLTHHERWDGKGYPLKLKGKAIPLVARIINVADSYDVMTNDRVYKKAVSKELAIKELKNCSGSQFDSEIVNLFIEYLEETKTN